MTAMAIRKIQSAEALTGLQRAAVLVMYLKEDVASRLLAHLSTEELQELSSAMAEVENITPDGIGQVVESFVNDLYTVSLVPRTGPEYALSVLPELLDTDRRHKVIGPLKRKLSTEFEAYIKSRPARTVAAILLDEHPQTQAVAFLLMGPENANAVMAFYADDQRYDIALRMARLDRIPGELADDVEQALRKALDDRGSDVWMVEGVDRAAAVLGRMNVDAQETLLGQIADTDFALSETLRRRMVTFTDLGVLDDRSVQQLLKNIDRDVLLVALRGADALLREVFFGNMSSRAADDMRDELEIGKPLPRAQVVDAQEEIVNTALRLKEEGLISLPLGGSDDEML